MWRSPLSNWADLLQERQTGPVYKIIYLYNYKLFSICILNG